MRPTALIHFAWLAALLTGCEAPATRQAPAAPRPAAPTRPQPAAPTVLPTATQLGYHRYVGTVDGRPVLAETTCQLTEHSYPSPPQYAEWHGSFYYRATGQGGWLGRANLDRADQTLETEDHELIGHYYEPITVLCADQPPGGPLLTGTYTPYGQHQTVPVRLRESYADGVRYEVLDEDSYGPVRHHPDGPDESAHVRQQYLHLLGPDTLRPALARLQCPTPAARRRARQRQLVGLGTDSYQEATIAVTLNEGNLLAYTCDRQEGVYLTDSYTRYHTRHYLFDLQTGRRLLLAAQLRPGGLRQVQHLLTRQARADTLNPSSRAHWWRGGQLALPAAGFEVTTTGGQATYGEPEAGEVNYYYYQTMTWAKLRPLLRPGTPLARLLRARGLW